MFSPNGFQERTKFITIFSASDTIQRGIILPITDYWLLPSCG